MKSKPKRILVINDETGFLEQFKQWLSFDGYVIETAETGESGLRMLKEQLFDLVFLDYYLKKENDGIKTATNFIPRIRQINASLPIIVTSASHLGLDASELSVEQVEYVNSSFWSKISNILTSFLS
jgi:two-component system, OmpR family, response regulator ResD